MMIRPRELPWGFGDYDHYAIYCTGHIDPVDFLAAVQEFQASDVPPDARAALKPTDIEHVRVRRLSPTEARSHGIDWGIITTDVGGYKVTMVTL